jgi:hypothetical protein
MGFSRHRAPSPSPMRRARRRGTVVALLSGLALLVPVLARAQYSAPEMTSDAVGEKYHVEASGTLWNPTVAGQVSSEQFGIIGSNIDFINDLGYTQTRFKDLRLVLRPTRKAKFRVQYTPVRYEAETTLLRDIVFNGQRFPVSLPIQSSFDWKVLRLGYEYDFLYRSRGFVGMLLEGRYTQMTTRLNSPVVSEFSEEKAPLPALGVVGRAYVLPRVAINFEVSGFKLPNVSPKYQAKYFDWDIHGTVNLNNYVGVEAGWRRMTTDLVIKHDTGNIKFQGLWFGAAVRY